ncbi:hypothetical protein cyc_00205 [Cyclospora cayetanensis]|uniref:Uncharacterized protein n=1 Tax=Cyclospora cayetanensis TaxID=88456 RepID=A0A1D3D670_9EIME|nr:hypothetical protein cyc_00205 [Cyclospora cayetanensis]
MEHMSYRISPGEKTTSNSNGFKDMPPFLQPMINTHSPCHRWPMHLPALVEATKVVLKELSGTATVSALASFPVPSTASTTAGETEAKGVEADFNDLESRKRTKFLGTRKEPQFGPKSVKVEVATIKSHSPLNPIRKADIPLALKPLGYFTDGIAVAVTEENALATQEPTERCNPHPLRELLAPSDSGLLPKTRADCTRVGALGKIWNGSPAAEIVAALGESSLRLATAAYEGLESSPSDVGGSRWQPRRGAETRFSGNSYAKLSLVDLPLSPKAPSSRRHCRATGPKGGMRPFYSPPVSSKRHSRICQRTPLGGRETKVPPNPVRASSPQYPTIRLARSACQNELPPDKGRCLNVQRKYNIDSGSQKSSCVESINFQYTGEVPAHNNPVCCCNMRSLSAMRNTSSATHFRSSELKQQEREKCVINLATPSPIASNASSFSQSVRKDFEGQGRSPKRLPPAGLGRHDPITSKYYATAASQAEGEDQFLALLQQSLGILQREASRCFATSQASMKQKLCVELQREKQLRLRLQQEHQHASAAVCAELSSMREQHKKDQRRLEKLLVISLNRKEAHDAVCLLRMAWRGWQQQRRLKRRQSQLQKVLQRRCVLLLLLRTFSPWRSATIRRTLVQQQQRAHQMIQHETDRLGQAHLEGMQQQQQQLARLQQQLSSETRLCECLKQSLIAIAGGGAIRGAFQGAVKPTASITTPVASESLSSGIFKGKRQQQRMPTEGIRHKQTPLAVVGMNVNLGDRRNQEQLQVGHKTLEFNALQQLPCWNWTQQNMGFGHFSSPSTAKKAISGAMKCPMDTRGRRVKFMDEEAHQQHQKQQPLTNPSTKPHYAVHLEKSDAVLGCSSPFGLDNQAHKDRRWTPAA